MNGKKRQQRKYNCVDYKSFSWNVLSYDMLNANTKRFSRSLELILLIPITHSRSLSFHTFRIDLFHFIIAHK